MPEFFTNRHVAYGADEMFEIVADVERYPEFVPLCRHHVVRSRETRGDEMILTTDMTVAHLVFRETFRSRVTLDKANGRIDIVAADGPVRSLHGRWTFRRREACRCYVQFAMSYELASRALAFVMGPVFNTAFSGFVHAFEQRAHFLHRHMRQVPAAPSVQPALSDMAEQPQEATPAQPASYARDTAS
jgi:coenzyme Q-binding protein COQ10